MGFGPANYCLFFESKNDKTLVMLSLSKHLYRFFHLVERCERSDQDASASSA